MTEAEWIASADAKGMLESLRGKLNQRKLRLFACACCRRVWHLLGDHRSRFAVDAAERHADGLTSTQSLSEAEAMAGAAFNAIPWGPDGQPGIAKLAASAAWAATETNLEETVFGGQGLVGFAINTALQAGDAAGEPESERAAQAALLRDILGNPFRPVAFDPEWLTSTVRMLAGGIYADRAFDRLPILADALQDAGCENGDILDHCHGEGPHVRGCWVVDLVLEKE